MSVLDFLATGIHRLAGILPDKAAAIVWLPLFAIATAILMRLAVRYVVPWAGQLGKFLLSVAVAVLAVPVMMLLVVISVPFRALHRSPPALVLGLDDALVSASRAALSGAQKAVTVTGRVARMNLLLVLIVTGVVIWRWDAAYCDTARPDCARPVVQWGQSLGWDWGPSGSTPASTPSPHPSPSPAKARR